MGVLDPPSAKQTQLPRYPDGSTLADRSPRPIELDPRDFDARSSSTFDSTAAFQACFDAAKALGVVGSVKVPPGLWMIHELDWPEVDVRGAGMGSTLFRYNGAGGPGSYMFRDTKDTGAIPYNSGRRHARATSSGSVHVHDSPP